MEIRRNFIGMVGILVLVMILTPLMHRSGPLPEEGRLAPNFNLATVNGHSVALQDLRGRPVFFLFLTPSNTPSEKEAALVEAMYKKYGKTIAFFSFVLDAGADPQPATRAFTKEFSLTYPVLYGSTSSVASLYRVTQVPTVFWINAVGVIVSRRDRPIGRSDMQAQFARLAATPNQ